MPGSDAQLGGFCADGPVDREAGLQFELVNMVPDGVAAVSAKYGTGYDLDGTNDRLRTTDTSTRTVGSLSMFLSFSLVTHDATNGESLIAFGGNSDSGISSDDNEVFQILVKPDRTIQYGHISGFNTANGLTSTSTLSDGNHAMTITRDVGTNIVVLKVDGTEFINDDYAEDPLGGTLSYAFVVGITSPEITLFAADMQPRELRYWKDQVVAQSVLDQIADPDDPDFTDVAEGNESFFWTLDTDCDITTTAPDSMASEIVQSLGTGTFFINATGFAPSVSPINFTMSGSATFGDDYSLSLGNYSVTFMGIINRSVVLTAIFDDIFPEGEESATLTLQPGGVHFSTGNNSTVVIVEERFIKSYYELGILRFGDSDSSSDNPDADVPTTQFRVIGPVNQNETVLNSTIEIQAVYDVPGTLGVATDFIWQLVIDGANVTDCRWFNRVLADSGGDIQSVNLSCLVPPLTPASNPHTIAVAGTRSGGTAVVSAFTCTAVLHQVEFWPVDILIQAGINITEAVFNTTELVNQTLQNITNQINGTGFALFLWPDLTPEHATVFFVGLIGLIASLKLRWFFMAFISGVAALWPFVPNDAFDPVVIGVSAPLGIVLEFFAEHKGWFRKRP